MTRATAGVDLAAAAWTDGASRPLTIVGAGLAGALLATLLAQRGWRITLFERRGDPRSIGAERGRSINLALAERGLHALRQAGLDDAVLRQAVMMRGRMVHGIDGTQVLQRYGRDDSEVIWSISRAELNATLLDAAQAAGVAIHFDARLAAVDFDARIASFDDAAGVVLPPHAFTALIGADGAGSAVRAAMAAVTPLGERFEPLGHGYKELEIPPGAGDSFAIEANALHIWPRGDFMCIALPNDEKTFTVTLFLPTEPLRPGAPSFATLRTGEDARAFFAQYFADALPLIPDLEHDFEHNPTGGLATLLLDRWHLYGRALLVGDAAHAMVPFHGQGMNCAFEDCVALAERLGDAGDDGRDVDLADAFAAFEAQRRPDARAIQDMALENYLEMRERVDDADYVLQRTLEQLLARRHPDRFVPRYAMVTFLRIPYATAQARGAAQRALLVEATQGRATLDDIDMAWLDAQVQARLAPLPIEA